MNIHIHIYIYTEIYVYRCRVFTLLADQSSESNFSSKKTSAVVYERPKPASRAKNFMDLTVTHHSTKMSCAAKTGEEITPPEPKYRQSSPRKLRRQLIAID